MSVKLQSALFTLLLSTASLAGLAGGAFAQNRGAPSQGGAQTSETMRLEVGTQQVISSENVRSYSEGIQGIVDIRLTGDAKQFVIVALKPGQTTLLLIMMDGSERLYRITVFDPNASKAGPAVVKDLASTVEVRDNIRLDFYFVQFDKSYGHQVGIDWPGRFGDATLQAIYDVQAGAFANATAVIQQQALPALDLAQNSGWAKILRHATLITANGTRANFMGGGEINIQIQGSLATGVHRIQFGSTIGVLPRYDSENGRLELEIHADVSDLADDRGTGTPGRVTSTLDTVVNLELGQSLMLAGLVAQSQARTHSGLPGLSQIPILGALFGTHSEVAQDTEDVVFIVPSVLDAVNLDSRARIKDALEAYDDYTGDIAGAKLPVGRTIPEPGRRPARPAGVVPEPEVK